MFRITTWSRRLQNSIEHGNVAWRRYTATFIQIRLTHTFTDPVYIFIKTNADTRTASAELNPHRHRLRGVNYPVSAMGVCVNERESVTKFHFPFWQRRATRLPVRRHLNRGGWTTSSFRKPKFSFLILASRS